jgi:hypothetical protein
LGKGLTFAYDYANHSPGASRRWRWRSAVAVHVTSWRWLLPAHVQPTAGPELRWTRQMKPLTTQSMKRNIPQNCGSRYC